MRVPTKKGPAVRPSQEVSGFLTDRGATPEAFGAGVARATQEVASLLSSWGDELEREHEQSQRFTAMQGLNQLQLDAAKQSIDLKREHDPATSNYYNKAQENWATLQQKYLATVPESLRPEMEWRTEQARKGVMLDAYTFEYTEKDRYYRKGLEDTLQLSQTSLEQNPSRTNLEANLQSWEEAVDASNLAEADKQLLKEKGRISLVTQHYKLSQKSRIQSGTAGAEYDLLIGHEGYRSAPYMDKSAKTGKPAGLRIGYGSDTITFPDGTFRRVRPGDKITKEQALLDLRRRVRTEFGPRAMKAVGAENWDLMQPELKAVLIGLAYQGAIARGYVKEAFRSGDRRQMAAAMDRLAQDFPVTKSRYMDYKAIILGEKQVGTGTIHTDPVYSSIPYEDRVALEKDAATELAAWTTQQQKEQKAQYESRFSSVLNRYANGQEGLAQHEQRIANNEYANFDDRQKADQTIKKYQGDMALLRNAQAKENDPGVLWGMDKEDRDFRNALHKDAQTRLGEFDQDYVVNSLVPHIARTKGIPDTALDALEGLVRRNDPKSMLFAMETLRQIQEQAPRVFGAQVRENLQREYDRYNVMRSYMPQDMIVSRLMGGLTQEDRTMRDSLRSTAKTIVETEKYVEDFEDNFGSLFSSPNLPYVADRKGQIQKEYTTLFQENYAVMGNEEKAHEATLRQIRRVWGVSQLSNEGAYLMRYPPDQFIPEGRLQFAQDDLETSLTLREGDKYQLITDAQTAAEVKQYQSIVPDGERVLPSYRVAIIRENGEMELLPENQRWAFQMNQFYETVEQEQLQKEIIEENFRDAVRDMERAQGLHSDAPAAPIEVQRELADKVRLLQEQMEEQARQTPAQPEQNEEAEARLELMRVRMVMAERRLRATPKTSRGREAIEREYERLKREYEGERDALSE